MTRDICPHSDKCFFFSVPTFTHELHDDFSLVHCKARLVVFTKYLRGCSELRDSLRKVALNPYWRREICPKTLALTVFSNVYSSTQRLRREKPTAV